MPSKPHSLIQIRNADMNLCEADLYLAQKLADNQIGCAVLRAQKLRSWLRVSLDVSWMARLRCAGILLGCEQERECISGLCGGHQRVLLKCENLPVFFGTGPS